jgi:SAM-dependent methyltransferase
MKSSFAAELVCPTSSHPLRLVVSEERDGEIGNGIPKMVPSDLVEQQRRTAAAFGWQWQHFVEMHPEFEAQFLDWISPLGPDSFTGKRVLDAGCGIGRHAYYAASYGAREVVALDLSGAVETARRNLARFANVHVVQGDLLRSPFPKAAEGEGFDLVYSIGVLHHLPDPEAGFRSLLEYLNPGGTIAVWVYGYENNGFVRSVVEPMRRVSTRMSPSVLRALAWPLALPFHALAKLVYRPLRRTRVGHALPLNEYMASAGAFSFRQNYGIVFDQLVAPTAAYIRESEISAWFEDERLEGVHISHRHENSWRGSGRLRGDQGAERR